MILSQLRQYENALEEIIETHGTHDLPRHECTKMANIARQAIEKYKNDEVENDQLLETERIAEAIFDLIRGYLSPKILYDYLNHAHRGYLQSRTNAPSTPRNKGGQPHIQARR